MIIGHFKTFLLVFSIMFFLAPCCGAQEADQFKGLDEQIQDIKSDVLDISVQLKDLEERLLFPSHSQVSVFLSMQKDVSFRLDSIDVDVDGLVAVQHLYSYKELEALQNGGAHNLYTGNLTFGSHAVSVVCRGKSESGDMIEKSATFSLQKGTGPVFYEFVITSNGILRADR